MRLPKEDSPLSCLLAIITVCRNDAERLSKTIDSLKDFYSDMRYVHIVVDGKSTDSTRQIVAPFMKYPNFLFTSEQDSGIYDAMNRGALFASYSKYILFLNCGDCMYATPEDIAQYLTGVESQKIKSAEIICFPYLQIGKTGLSRQVFPQRLSLNKLPSSHQSMFFSREFFVQQRYDTRYKIAADYDLFLRANLSRVLISSANFFLVSVEIEGVASQNPVAAYREYLLSACKHTKGRLRIRVLTQIAVWACIVIFLKWMLPNKWIVKLRGGI